MSPDRFSAQLLAGRPAPGPLGVVEHLLAVQSQDLSGARLAIRVRTADVTAADVDRALTSERTILVTWLNRGTLHLVRSEDYWWLQALTAPSVLTATFRRLDREGVSADAAERGVAVIEKALSSDGPLSRAQLGERLTSAGVPTAGQALVYILVLASRRGLTVRGPIIEGRHAYVLVRDWLGEPKPVDRDRSLAELCRRYLAGHAPADSRDLAKWAGLPLRDVRAGLNSIASELEERPDGLVTLRGRKPATEMPRARLLGSFEPVLMGWRSREWILGTHPTVVTVNGLFRPFALVGGRAVATWSISGGAVTLKPFGALAQKDVAALAKDADAVTRYLGLSSLSPMSVATG